MIHQMLQGATLILVTVFIHGTGTVVFLGMLERYGPFWERHGGIVVNTLSLTWVVGTLILLHLLEIGVWAVYYAIMGVFPDLATSAYFSLITYTTVGYGDVVLPQEWRLFGGSEALVGILMTAWSTALLLGVVNALHAKIIEKWRTSKTVNMPKDGENV